MGVVITDRRSGEERTRYKRTEARELLGSVLPPRLTLEIEAVCRGRLSAVEEIRLRRQRPSSLTLAGENLRLGTVLSGEEMDRILSLICEESLYAHSETIKRGYVTVGDGIRVGICGRAVTERGEIVGIYDVTALNFRLPRRVDQVGTPVVELLRKSGRGILIYSPPAVGKTTLLRSVARRLSTGSDAIRVALIDTREELGALRFGEGGLIDVLSGYPRAIGIEIAVRSMNPQLIICDEIGDRAEAEAMISAQNCGVPFVATATAWTAYSGVTA